MNPADDINLLRIINQPARGIGKVTLENLTRCAREARRSVWDELQRQRDGGRVQAGLEKFSALIHRYHIRVQQETAWSQIMKDLLEEIGYFEDLRRASKDHNEVSSRCENVQEFVSSLADYERQREGALQNFVDNLRLEQKEDKDEEKDGFGVTLMTLHAAKGLEFRRVFLVGVEEGILPHDRSKLEGNIEEERRLFYVGITRAMKGLALSYCDKRLRYGKEEPRHPSSFLAELPPDVFESVNARATLTEVKPEQVASRFSALKAKLGKG
ncbi:MAG: ATP-dependent helicase [Verrucomicrobiales bacterium]|jgi:superfamily I DNA/RNA helicase|nr:ATP-dependent helicase [Verrucomicrobiales bacterium]